MFKYVLPVVLIEGKSSRCGKNKFLLKLNGVSFLDLVIDLLFSLGFIKCIVSGMCIKYKCIKDVLQFCGPLGGFYSVFTNIYISEFFRILFIPIDMCFLSREILLNLLFNFGIFISLSYKKSNLPILLFVSKNITSILNKLYHKKRISYSINFLFFYMLVKNISIDRQCFYLFRNINTVIELDLYKRL